MQKIKTAALILSLLTLSLLVIPTPIFARRTTLSQPWWVTTTPTRLNRIIPTKVPLPTVSQEATPTPTPTKKLIPTPTSQPSTSTDVKKTFIMNAINNFRTSQGLSTVSTDSYTCGFAKVRAQEISTNFSHDEFSNRVNSETLPYPSYHLITENIARTSDYKKVVDLWINSTGHRENMEKDTPYVCVENYGDNYSYEGWKP